ncbi:Uncharacterized protein MBO1_02030 [Mycobacterium tuberculosis variant bovis]|nr:hypothetical protein K60_009820 [Mycobacterium tuberculosis variant bovis BCG str. Korea 1168P]CEJ30267.1 Uncharacterized protein MBO_501661 [Mycobacterium tuberculosis variant bovis]CEJ35931.1 Uncharacterized protein MBO1_02030 [Mycobacterium tuberculosis variant bovis]CEJ49892.1 Uncharacterized protein MBO_200102 [Mycobacterium tuberculosis variant caprae]
MAPRVGPRQARSANPQIGPKLHRAGAAVTANVWCRAGGIRMAPRPVIPVATQQRLRRQADRQSLGGSGLPALNCTPIRHTIDVMATKPERKTERLAARLTPEQDALIRRAAEAEGTDLTNFTVTAALAHARDVLADRRLFVLTDAAWTEFLAALDRPVSHKPRLEKLFAARSIFDTEG